MPRTTRSTAYPMPTTAYPNLSTDQFQIPDAIKQVFTAENDNQLNKSAIFQVVEILKALVKIFALVVGVGLWSVSSIPNILVSAAIIFCSSALWSNTKDTLVNSYDYANSFLDPTFSTVNGFATNLQNLSDCANQNAVRWDESKEQQIDAYLILLNLIEVVGKAGGHAQEIEKAKKLLADMRKPKSNAITESNGPKSNAITESSESESESSGDKGKGLFDN